MLQSNFNTILDNVTAENRLTDHSKRDKQKILWHNTNINNLCVPTLLKTGSGRCNLACDCNLNDAYNFERAKIGAYSNINYCYFYSQ